MSREAIQNLAREYQVKSEKNPSIKRYAYAAALLRSAVEVLGPHEAEAPEAVKRDAKSPLRK